MPPANSGWHYNETVDVQGGTQGVANAVFVVFRTDAWISHYIATQAVHGVGSDYNIAPNPASTKISVSWTENSPSPDATFTLYDALGRLCKQGQLLPSIDIADLLNGVYALQIIDKSGAVLQTTKVVVQH